MDCEQAHNFIWRKIDGEFAADDAILLDAHLATCASCRAVEQAATIEDAELAHAFADHRASAAALAERVTLALERDQAAPRPRRRLLQIAAVIPWFAAAAACLLAGILLMEWRKASRPSKINGPQIVELTSAQPIGSLELARGAVFTCPGEGSRWSAATPGTKIGAGARVRTDLAASCEVQLDGGTFVRLNAATEATFADARNVRMARGELWSSAPLGAAAQRQPDALRIVAGDTCVSAPARASLTDAQFQIACQPGATIVSVLQGAADVTGRHATTAVHTGQSARDGAATMACVPTDRSIDVADWMDDLLLLKPADDPEVQRRIAALLDRVTLERRSNANLCPGPTEAQLRSRGDGWTRAIAVYLLHGSSPDADRDTRRQAAHLLADLAPIARRDDLMTLAKDVDSKVAAEASAAFSRLSGGVRPGE